jgi:hypothetical protein
MEIISDLLIIGLVWIFAYNIFFSREAQVRRILKQMYNLPIKFSRLIRKWGSDKDGVFSSACIEQLESKYKFINALLDYRFDSEADKEYIREKKEQARNWLDNGKSIMLNKK